MRKKQFTLPTSSLEEEQKGQNSILMRMRKSIAARPMHGHHLIVAGFGDSVDYSTESISQFQIRDI
jgi:hypothetical protein